LADRLSPWRKDPWGSELRERSNYAGSVRAKVWCEKRAGFEMQDWIADICDGDPQRYTSAEFAMQAADSKLRALGFDLAAPLPTKTKHAAV
jgi:hypothetical protein